MDAYEVYLNTLRYVLKADPDDKSTWNDIFKYLPCLHQMLLCCVCGNLLNRPQGPINSVCLHHVCHGCVGGKMRLKPSCSWCKDHSHFIENKKLRILVLCFKRLCAYISHSKLGPAILNQSTNGPGKDPELTRQVLKDADEFVDDFPFTEPPMGLPKLIKTSPGGLNKCSNLKCKPSTSRISTVVQLKDSQYRSRPNDLKQGGQNLRARRGRRRKNLSKIPLKSAQSNTSIHIKRLKRKALTVRNNTSTKKFPLKLPNSSRFIKRNASNNSSGLLITQRPHRELSGKFSIGQLWRETFLEERPPEPEIYPDSGIEVGNASDQDHGSQPPTLKHQIDTSVKAPAKIETPERAIHVRDTRLHPAPESMESSSTGNSESNVTENHHKPRLTLTIPKRQFSKSKGSRKGQQKSSAPIKENTDSSSSEFAVKLPNKILNLKRRGLKSSGRSLSRRRDICRCARFKQPNQLTCFGQKCPCYRDRKACVDCLCNGCKNPRRKADPVPALLHMANETASCVQHGIDPSMPRLSPIPRI